MLVGKGCEQVTDAEEDTRSQTDRAGTVAIAEQAKQGEREILRYRRAGRDSVDLELAIAEARYEERTVEREGDDGTSAETEERTPKKSGLSAFHAAKKIIIATIFPYLQKTAIARLPYLLIW